MLKTTIKTQANLQLKTFEHHIISTASEIMWTGYSTDCEILSKDKVFPCHRLILSSASPFLAKILETADPARLPQIIIPDVSSEVLQMVISIIYQGETFVPADSRSELMEICRLLELKGTQEFYNDTTNQITNSLETTMEQNLAAEEYNPIAIENNPIRETDDYNMDADASNDSDLQIADEFADEFDDETSTSFGQIKGQIEVQNKLKPVVKLERLRQSAPQAIHKKTIDNPRVKIVYTSESEFGKFDRMVIQENEIEPIHGKLVNSGLYIFTNKLKDGGWKYGNADVSAELYINMDRNLLMYGKVSCLICDKKVRVYYKRKPNGDFKQWDAQLLIRHVNTDHSDLVLFPKAYPRASK